MTAGTEEEDKLWKYEAIGLGQTVAALHLYDITPLRGVG